MEKILVEFSDILTKNIVDAINNHAIPRPYDYWLLAFTALSVILSFCAIFATIKIAKRQTSISEKQTEIMEQQNKIALFDKKWELYNALETLHLILRTYYFTVQKETNCNYKVITRCDNDIAKHKGFVDKFQLLSYIDNAFLKIPTLFNINHISNYINACEQFQKLQEHISKEFFKNQDYNTDETLLTLFDDFLKMEDELKTVMEEIKLQISLERS